MEKLLKYLSFFTLVFTLAFALKVAITTPLSPDSWLHVGIGRYIVENKRIPNHSDISFKKVEASLELLPHSWLADSLMYISIQSGSATTAVFVVFGLLLLSLYLLNRILTTLQIFPQIRALALSILTLAALSYWRLHPLIFATPIILLMIVLYVHWLKHRSNSIWLLPVLFIAYANVAGGYIYIPIFLFVSIIVWQFILQIVDRKNLLEHKSVNKYSHFIASTIVSFFAIYLNPSGYLLFPYALSSYAILSSPRKWLSTLMGALKILNQNFVKNGSSSFYLGFALVFFILLLTLITILVIRKRTSFLKKIINFVPFIFLLVFPLLWMRYVPIIGFIVLPLFAIALNYFFQNSPMQHRFKYVLIALSTGLCIVIELLFLNTPRYQYSQLPDKQVKLISKLSLEDNVFTSPDMTGYFFYKSGGKAFLDAQDDFYDENESLHYFLYEQYISSKLWSKIALDNGIQTILTDKDYVQLPKILNKDPQWSLVYFDTSGYVYYNTNTMSDSFNKKHAVKYLDFMSDLGFDPKNATASATEMKNYLKLYPDNVQAKGHLATILRTQYQFKDAQKLLQSIPDAQKDYIVYTELGRVTAADGDCTTAEGYFLKALEDRNETNFSRATLDLAVLYVGCLNEPEKAKRYFQRFNSYAIPSTEREKVKKLMQDFGLQSEDF